MTVWESIKTAWGSILSNKLRSSLTMLGLMIGVAAVVLLVSPGQGYQASVTSTFNSLGATAFYVTGSRDKTIPTIRPLTIEDVAALQDPVLALAVGVVSTTLGASVTVSYGNSGIKHQMAFSVDSPQ
ncbi:MAG: ABC transporter permease [Dehalococcoidia bacterium]|jgi:putative ABC transport system permease protein